MVEITEVEPESKEELNVDESAEEKKKKGSKNEIEDEGKVEENTDSSSSSALSSWTKLMGDNIQMKSLSTDSTNTTNNNKAVECQPQDAAVIDFIGRFAPTRDVEDGPIFHEVKDCLIVVGDKYVNPALEMGVRFMHEGQSAVLWSHSKFAYGLAGRKWNNEYELPPNSNVRYEITLKRIFSPNEESTDPDGFQLRLAMSKKLIANDMFKNELYNDNVIGEQRALRLYNKAGEEMLHLLQTHASRKEEKSDKNEYKEEEHKEKLQQAQEIMLDSLNNVVAVYLKAKKYHEAKEAAVKVLTHDPNNYKALLRAARAAMLDPAGTYEESDAAIAAAERVVATSNNNKDLDDKEVRKLRQELQRKKLEYKKRSKQMMERMTKDLKTKPSSKKKEVEDPQQSSSSMKESQLPATTTTTTTTKAGAAAGAGNETNKNLNLEKEANTGDNNDTAPTTKTSTTEEEEEVVHPLWRRSLPYLIQIVFPFILYYMVTMTSKNPQQQQQYIPPGGRPSNSDATYYAADSGSSVDDEF